MGSVALTEGGGAEAASELRGRSFSVQSRMLGDDADEEASMKDTLRDDVPHAAQMRERALCELVQEYVLTFASASSVAAHTSRARRNASMTPDLARSASAGAYLVCVVCVEAGGAGEVRS